MIAVANLVEDPVEREYRAWSGSVCGAGATAALAVEDLLGRLGPEKYSTIIVQRFGPDEFFPEPQYSRLSSLMKKWRHARENGGTWSTEEQSELERLIDEQFEASGRRALAIADAQRS